MNVSDSLWTLVSVFCKFISLERATEMLTLYIRLQPNGLKVLSLIPGLLESFEGGKVDSFISYSTLTGDDGLLGSNDVPSTFPKAYGNSMLGVRRTTLHAGLVATCEKYGVEIKWDHHCTGFDQKDDSVTATFANGETATGSFIIGCDGLHSVVRVGLFGKETASYTGLTQVSCHMFLPLRSFIRLVGGRCLLNPRKSLQATCYGQLLR